MQMRFALVVLALWSLACSGATEKVVRWTTGAEIEETEEGGAEVRMPGGINISVDASGEVPSTFPMPPPWDGARPETVTTTTLPTGDEPMISVAVSYPLASSTDDITRVYARWMKARMAEIEARDAENESGWEVSQKSKSLVPGFRVTKLALEEREDTGPKGLVKFEVLMTEGYGMDSLSVTHSVLGAHQFPSSLPWESGDEAAVESKKARSSD